MIHRLFVFIALLGSAFDTGEGSQLFPFGSSENDINNKNSWKHNSGTVWVPLEHPMMIFGQARESIPLNDELSIGDLRDFYFSPYYKLSSESGGLRWYRVVEDYIPVRDAIRTRTNNNLFHANESVIVTWENVTFLEYDPSESATFQAVLTTDSTRNHTYAIYIYGTVNDNIIEKNTLAAFFFYDVNNAFSMEMLNGSRSQEFRQLVLDSSNVDLNGMWIFRVDSTDYEVKFSSNFFHSFYLMSVNFYYELVK